MGISSKLSPRVNISCFLDSCGVFRDLEKRINFQFEKHGIYVAPENLRFVDIYL